MARDEAIKHSSVSFSEVVSAGMLWSSFVYAFVRPTVQQFVFASFIGAFYSMLFNAFGIALVVLFVGLQGKSKKPRTYFLVLTVLRILRLPLAFLAAIDVLAQTIPLVYYSLAGASYALFVIAWCQYYSEKSDKEKSDLLVPSILLSIFFVFVLMLLPFTSSAIICVVMQIVAVIIIFVGKQKPRSQEADTPLSKQRKTVFLIFGIMIGFLLVACPSMVHDSPLEQVVGTIFFYAWIIFVFGVAILSFVVMRRYPSVGGVLQQLLPVLVLGLLAPPFLLYGLDGVFPAVVIFVSLGEMIVFSTGKVGTYFSTPFGKRPFAKHPFTKRSFVFWERSVVLVGFVLGTVCTSLFVSEVSADSAVGFLIVGALAYSAFCLMTLSLSSKRGKGSAQTNTYQGLMSFVAERVASSYALTPREKEVFNELAQGRNVPYIQEKLFISEATVSSHIHHIYQKLEIRNRQELHDIVQKYLTAGDTDK